MGALVLAGNTSGSVTVDVPAVAGSNTATFPASTGTVMVSGNMPAFSAYLASAQTVTSTTVTKVAYDTEVFDTNNNFASNRFTPTVAGYYQVNATLCGQSSATITQLIGYIYKNGASYRFGVLLGTSSNTRATISDLIYMNGTTDYLEIFARLDGTGTLQFAGGADASSFSACLVRGA
jgi:hypothetical protein